MNIQEIKHNAKENFAKYTSNYDLSQPKIALKAKHTYKVAELCERIAIKEGFTKEEVLVAWMCGLLHDIGRFEQVRRYNTFYDAESVDHAHLSCQILFSEDLFIRNFMPDDKYDEEIKLAIYWHSAFRYPEDLTELQKKFCSVIRDADKIDIFRVNLETPLSEIHNMPQELFYTSEPTKEVMDAFLSHSCVLRSLKKTAIDHVISYTSLYWELEYDESRKIALKQGYLLELASFESKNEKTNQFFAIIRKELGFNK